MINYNYNHKNDRIRILGTGLSCLDIITYGKQRSYYSGGSCGNVISALSFLGWDSHLISHQFSDIAGKILNTNLDNIGVKRIEVGNKPLLTPRIVEKLNIQAGKYLGHEFLLSCPECGKKLPKVKLISASEARKISNTLRGYNALYSDRNSPGIQILRKLFHDNGAWTVYEPNSARNIKSFITNSLDSAIAKFSFEKVPYNLAEELRQKSPRYKTILIIQTQGKDGLIFSYRKKDKNMSSWIHLPAQPITHLVDAAGAGDWCTAGMLMSFVTNKTKRPNYLTRNESISALQYGQALSAISCSFVGGQGLIYAEKNKLDMNKLTQGIKLPLLKQIKPASVSGENYHHFCQFCLQQPI